MKRDIIFQPARMRTAFAIFALVGSYVAACTIERQGMEQPTTYRTAGSAWRFSEVVR